MILFDIQYDKLDYDYTLKTMELWKTFSAQVLGILLKLKYYVTYESDWAKNKIWMKFDFFLCSSLNESMTRCSNCSTTSLLHTFVSYPGARDFFSSATVITERNGWIYEGLTRRPWVIFIHKDDWSTIYHLWLSFNYDKVEKGYFLKSVMQIFRTYWPSWIKVGFSPNYW